MSDPAFLAAYAALVLPDLTKLPGQARKLVDAFRASDEYGNLSESYRRALNRNLDVIRRADHKATTADVIQTDIDAIDAPIAARERAKAWRVLCRFGKLRPDPSKGLVIPAAPETHIPWSNDEIARYRERWPIGTKERHAMELLLWTGARTIDAATLGPRSIATAF